MLSSNSRRAPLLQQVTLRLLKVVLATSCSLLTACGGKSEADREIDAQKKEAEKVEIQTIELSRTTTERRVKVQTKDMSHGVSIASQPDGLECEGSVWGGKKGKCWAEGDKSTGESGYWTLVVRKDVQVEIAFRLTGCQKGLIMDSCKSETLYRTIDIKGP